ncbi:hypothetical protein [Ligilactobacillus agilis]|uniref:hypothetical protein n=1 Tax=Ligilactobacillus agilis TaxID=1601 RepID=UPI0014381DB3|nr:hypothetical protein [Ligilactobacillus agilis]MCI5762264.1 hypothetical protein [Ligilactobacillus agilis]MCL8204485.1 hypothetical protein [Ligilactobacillus agilis]MDK6808968.1 hypothetical protein [Ligilactobacillus agilis]MDY4065173.1 hypothetical protein [Ligilactobacillus agilis]GET19106.1 hypothetical protein PTL465_14240 [Ligilactobacillus agilis]
MQLKENKTTTKLTKQDLQTIVGGVTITNFFTAGSPFRNLFHATINKLLGRG